MPSDPLAAANAPNWTGFADQVAADAMNNNFLDAYYAFPPPQSLPSNFGLPMQQQPYTTFAAGPAQHPQQLLQLASQPAPYTLSSPAPYTVVSPATMPAALFPQLPVAGSAKPLSANLQSAASYPPFQQLATASPMQPLLPQSFDYLASPAPMLSPPASNSQELLGFLANMDGDLLAHSGSMYPAAAAATGSSFQFSSMPGPNFASLGPESMLPLQQPLWPASLPPPSEPPRHLFDPPVEPLEGPPRVEEHVTTNTTECPTTRRQITRTTHTRTSAAGSTTMTTSTTLYTVHPRIAPAPPTETSLAPAVEELVQRAAKRARVDGPARPSEAPARLSATGTRSSPPSPRRESTAPAFVAPAPPSSSATAPRPRVARRLSAPPTDRPASLPTRTNSARAAPRSADDTSSSSSTGGSDQPLARCLWFTCSATFSDAAELVPHLSTAHTPANHNRSNTCKWGGAACVELGDHKFESTDELVGHLLEKHIKAIFDESHQCDGGSGHQHAHGATGEGDAAHAQGPPTAELASSAPADAVAPGDQASASSRTPPAAAPAAATSASTTNSYDLHVCLWTSCGAHYPSFADLTTHVSEDHIGFNRPPYVCEWRDCDRQGRPFTQRQKVMRHLQMHTGFKPYQCVTCSQRFSEHTVLASHMRTHSGEKPFACDFEGCAKNFSIMGALTVHRRTHTGERPFACKFEGCTKTFAESSNLTKHTRTHTKDRPFRCPVCDRGFSRPDQARRHLKTHRESPPPEEEAGNADISKAILGVILVTCLIGPGLIIGGAYMLSIAGTPTRETAVASFINVSQQWASGSGASNTSSWSQLNATYAYGSAEEGKLSSTEPAVPFPSKLNWLQASVPGVNGSSILAWGSSGTNLFAISASVVPPSRTYAITLPDCRTSTCTQSSQSDRDACNRRPLCSTACSSRDGVWNSSTAQCTLTLYVKSMCFVYSPASNTIETSSGCYYESTYSGTALPSYGLAQYSSTRPSAIRVQVRHSDDPILYASRVTQGSYYFGLSMEQKQTIGISLLIPGIVIVGLISCCVCGLVFRRRRRTEANKVSAEPAPPYQSTAQIVPLATAAIGSMMGQPQHVHPQAQQPQPAVYAGYAAVPVQQPYPQPQAYPGYPPPPQQQAYPGYPPSQQQAYYAGPSSSSQQVPYGYAPPPPPAAGPMSPGPQSPPPAYYYAPMPQAPPQAPPAQPAGPISYPVPNGSEYPGVAAKYSS
ncbi:zinc-finger protein [Blastocladiella emersonii ATCC 22665]|nr:zinc-finger protein [Blastocladiella emersonii ATCC 22665]